jgi:hypothetical protein
MVTEVFLRERRGRDNVTKGVKDREEYTPQHMGSVRTRERCILQGPEVGAIFTECPMFTFG